MHSLHAQLIRGPTLLLEYAGLRWLSDPTLSPPGHYGWLEKTTGPALVHLKQPASVETVASSSRMTRAA